MSDTGAAICLFIKLGNCYKYDCCIYLGCLLSNYLEYTISYCMHCFVLYLVNLLIDLNSIILLERHLMASMQRSILECEG